LLKTSHTDTLNTQSEFDLFYNIATVLLDAVQSLTSRDPHYMTAAIKSKLRRKNRLIRAARVEKANSLAERIGKAITRRCEIRLSLIDGSVAAKGMCADSKIRTKLTEWQLNHWMNIMPLYMGSMGSVSV